MTEKLGSLAQCFGVSLQGQAGVVVLLTVMVVSLQPAVVVLGTQTVEYWVLVQRVAVTITGSICQRRSENELTLVSRRVATRCLEDSRRRAVGNSSRLLGLGDGHSGRLARGVGTATTTVVVVVVLLMVVITATVTMTGKVGGTLDWKGAADALSVGHVIRHGPGGALGVVTVLCGGTRSSDPGNTGVGAGSWVLDCDDGLLGCSQSRGVVNSGSYCQSSPRNHLLKVVVFSMVDTQLPATELVMVRAGLDSVMVLV